MTGWFSTLFKKKQKEPYTEDALGHNHEWDDMYYYNKKGEYVQKEGWIYCWICSEMKEWKPKPRTFTRLDSPLGRDIISGKLKLK